MSDDFIIRAVRVSTVNPEVGRGTYFEPGGGGHWLVAIGYTQAEIIVHDPFGEMDLIRGGYVNSRGARLRYSRRNLGPRWMVEGPGTGWAIIAEPLAS